MGSYQSEEEIKKEHIKKLGPKLGLVFHEIRNEVLTIHFKWSEFEALYTNGNRVKIMHEISSTFYIILRNLLLDDLILGITRLTQRKSDRRGNTRLTLGVLVEMIPPPLKGEIGKILKRIENESLFCNEIRNNKIAHFDKRLALNENTEPLEIATREKINIILNSISEFLDTIQSHYMNSTSLYRFRSETGSEVLLLAKRGLSFIEARSKILREKGFDIDDYIDE